MAKSKKKTTNKKVEQPVSDHSLPDGFWAQVGAIALIALSILFIVAWFQSGGPVIQWIYKNTQNLIGYSVYILPFFMTFLAVEIFKSKENRLPMPVKFASLFMLFWFSGLFGLITDKAGKGSGGILGDLLNKLMLSIASSGVSLFLYILLIFVTFLFIAQVQPITVIKKIMRIIKRDDSEFEANKTVLEGASLLNGSKEAGVEFKINNTVPIVDTEAGKKRFSSFGGSTPRDKESEEGQVLVSIRNENWESPSLDLLVKKQTPADPGDAQHNAAVIRDTLSNFGIDVEMEGANVGPKVTQYTMRPSSNVKLEKISQLENNLSLNLAASSLRIEAPIPGQKLVGIEVPNKVAGDVRLYSILNSKDWKAAEEPLTFAIGKDVLGKEVIGALDSSMPHILIAGQTGAGKSVMVNTLLISLLYRNSPSQLKMILVDPKEVEMSMYEDIPHLLTPIITNPEKTISALKWTVNEMQRRYSLMSTHHAKEIKVFNKMVEQNIRKGNQNDEDTPMETMPYIVVVIDEMADLMMQAPKDVEALIVRLAQKGRAAGIHLVLATQRPSVNIITGLIKANVPGRIAFTVSQQIDSRVILDSIGAEKLLGKGDMLYKTPTSIKPARIQGAFISDDEVKKVTSHLKLQSPPQYNDEVVSQPVQFNGKGGVVMDYDGGSDDPMYKDALQVVMESGKASTSYLQRRLRIGYGRASRLIDIMEEQGAIGPADGSRPREVLISSLDELDT